MCHRNEGEPVELEYARRPSGAEPPRRFETRSVLAGLIAAVAAAVAVLGLARGETQPTSIGTGVVVIETNLGYQGGRAAGTGMVLTSSGEVLTNNHVIRGATEITVEVPSTGRSYPAEVVGYSVSDDIAVIRTSGASNLKTASLGDSATVDVGQSVQAVGNAGGTGRLSTASGTVTSVDRSITVGDDKGGSESLSGLIETDAAVKPGDSGGPLLNTAGQVIGIDTAASAGNEIDQTAPSEGYAIPINKAVGIAQQIDSGTDSARVHVGGTAFLGVEATTDSYGGTGAAIATVLSGSPAEAAGLVPGDLTPRSAATRSPPRQRSAIVMTQKPGASLFAVYVDQQGATQTTNLTLASGPPR
jgi:S1-C subfamily serine protease